MPIRFSTKAANADVMGEEPSATELPDDTPQAAAPDETGTPARESRSDAGSKPGLDKPGKDSSGT